MNHIYLFQLLFTMFCRMANILNNYAFLQTIGIWLEENFTFMQPWPDRDRDRDRGIFTWSLQSRQKAMNAKMVRKMRRMLMARTVRKRRPEFRDLGGRHEVFDDS